MGLEEDIAQKKFRSQYQKVVVNLLYTSSWINSQQIQLFKPFDLTPAQYNVLRILRGQHPQPATVNLIIERMLDKMSNASRIVDKLLTKDLVVRHTCPSDRRMVHVSITEKGLKLLEEIDLTQCKWEESLQVLSEQEANQLNLLLDKLRTAGC
jgi:DNA-binding MarR family transcriptional regulator